MVFVTPVAAVLLITQLGSISMISEAAEIWVALGYLAVVSMFFASVFWSQILAFGGIARIGQINLPLPLAALGWSALLLFEEITWTAAVCALVVLISMPVCLKGRT